MRTYKLDKKKIASAIIGLSLVAQAFAMTAQYQSGDQVGEEKCQPQFGLGNLPAPNNEFRNCCAAGCESFPHPNPNYTVGMCIDKCMDWNQQACTYRKPEQVASTNAETCMEETPTFSD